MSAAGYVTFSVGGSELALDLAPVQEVLRVGPIAPIPRAARRARGLTRVRGRLVAVVDVAVALGLPVPPVTDQSRILLVTRGARLLGLLVDRVHALRPSAEDDTPELLDLDHLLGAG
jgi:chemotaxis signal transduction protein